ncbi:MAG: hypothetical protein KAI83_16875 [Thiomargarita sp.]|nr:hypothetical protein [Thiomargarita sp.]
MLYGRKNGVNFFRYPKVWLQTFFSIDKCLNVATTGIQKTLKPFIDKGWIMTPNSPQKTLKPFIDKGWIMTPNSPQKTLKPFIDKGWSMANLIDVVAENHIQLLSLNN